MNNPKLLPAPKYVVCYWTRNYHDDWDSMATVFDPNRNCLDSVLIGSTRFGSLPYTDNSLATPNEAIQAQFLPLVVKTIASRFKLHEDLRRIRRPFEKGDSVVTKEGGKFKNKETGKFEKYQAGETGKVIWTGFFGTFYKSGYKQQTKNYQRVGVRFDSGRVIFLEGSKIELSTPVDEQAFLKQAQDIVSGGRWEAYLGDIKSFI
jgi:hypothetical protein